MRLVVQMYYTTHLPHISENLVPYLKKKTHSVSTHAITLHTENYLDGSA